jgi:shikimate dehydrogenase
VSVHATTKLFVLLGDPVQHSLSPRMQNAAFEASGIDAVYVALRCSTDHVRSLMAAIAAAGGGGNVTVPHKQTAAAALDRPSDVVQATGACNTFWLDGGALAGDNTDVIGFLTAAHALLGPLQGTRALVLGAGGSARAAVYGLLREGADRITVVGRSLPRVKALLAQLDPSGQRIEGFASADPVRGASFDLVVNATPAGMHGSDSLPVDFENLGTVRAALDMVYGDEGTALVHSAERCGIPALDGAEILIAQGAASFSRWFRREAPVEVMRTVVLAGRRALAQPKAEVPRPR